MPMRSGKGPLSIEHRGMPDWNATEELSQDITRRILEFCQPERVILFGSVSRHETREDSDLDLLVVWEGDPTFTDHQRYCLLRKAIGSIHAPLDLITYTPVEFDNALQNPRSFAAQILKEGKTLYARCH